MDSNVFVAGRANAAVGTADERDRMLPVGVAAEGKGRPGHFGPDRGRQTTVKEAISLL